MTVERNSYGRQLQSAIRTRRSSTHDLGAGAAGRRGDRHRDRALIRAPRIVEPGPGVRVRARLDGDPVWVEQGRVMATTFHPELGADTRPHRRFLQLTGPKVTGEVAAP